jgi:hypothetical protein
MINSANTRPFFTGLLAGIAITLSAVIMLAMVDSDDGRENQQDQRVIEPLYFATGGMNNATLWRRNADGTLTCISRNECRVPERSRW